MQGSSNRSWLQLRKNETHLANSMALSPQGHRPLDQQGLYIRLGEPHPPRCTNDVRPNRTTSIVLVRLQQFHRGSGPCFSSRLPGQSNSFTECRTTASILPDRDSGLRAQCANSWRGNADLPQFVGRPGPSPKAASGRSMEDYPSPTWPRTASRRLPSGPSRPRTCCFGNKISNAPSSRNSFERFGRRAMPTLGRWSAASRSPAEGRWRRYRGWTKLSRRGAFLLLILTSKPIFIQNSLGILAHPQFAHGQTRMSAMRHHEMKRKLLPTRRL